MGLEEFIADSQEARFYKRGSDHSVTCGLCARKCSIEPGEAGFCGMRYNDGGKLLSLAHGRVAAVHLAPSELKPFFHFYPGALWLSVGTIGCNLKCRGCQNWHFAHSEAYPGLLSTQKMTGRELAELADKAACAGLSFTYNEPTVWLEYTIEASRAARDLGLLTTYVSNGLMSTEPLKELLEVISAFRFDVKGFSSETYKKLAGPTDWQQVKKNAELVAKKGIHLEIITNIVPGVSDDEAELAGLAAWIRKKLGRHVPWHVTRFRPAYTMMDVPPTPLDTLEKAHQIGTKAGLDFVYIGNVPGHPNESTYCPKCGRVLIQRQGLIIAKVDLDGNRCRGCGQEVNIVGAPEEVEA
jgi:pyruvate formate lyase activating enzyme